MIPFHSQETYKLIHALKISTQYKICQLTGAFTHRLPFMHLLISLLGEQVGEKSIFI